MQIELTPEQYRKLLMLIFLGEWILNGSAANEDGREAVQDVADYIYSLAHQFGAEDWVEYCDNCGGYHANQAMEEVLLPFIDEYDEETFWDVLSHHLAYRDVMATVGPDQEMTKELELKLWRRKEQYEQEFQKHGLDHVRLVFHGGKAKKKS
ncbi:hypothetical protein GCM10010885_06830 [Alicyclobacillus cellulosilyticus]|uniref:Uncharacterized protein n=2 Tax=Alicyclobacillus cellulosilyticus TaxID=1003997 RepID=A0A917NIE7_9BACL|nr:hypothetical protein GCM10010885_06830 [Alicyclobacillus cellulosilyticus]